MYVPNYGYGQPTPTYCRIFINDVSAEANKNALQETFLKENGTK